MSHRIISSLKLLSLSLLIGLTTSAVFAWTGPTAAPTGGNTPAPLNVSSASQSKSGSLRLGGVRTSLSSYINFASSADLTVTPYGTTNFNALSLAVNGKVGATQYCDQYGENCTTTVGGGGGGTCTAAAGSVYDSGWVTVGGEQRVVLNHNLGTLDTVVDFQARNKNSPTTITSFTGATLTAESIHNYISTAIWYDKTENTITVARQSGGENIYDKFRVVMWKKSAIGAGCGGGTGGTVTSYSVGISNPATRDLGTHNFCSLNQSNGSGTCRVTRSPIGSSGASWNLTTEDPELSCSAVCLD